MKAILMSIQSKWLCEILNGRKTIELRKRFPKDYRGWVYLYCTKAKPYLYCTKGYGSLHRCRGNGRQFFIVHYKELGYISYINGRVVARVWVDNVEELITLSWDTQTATLSKFGLSVKSRVSIKDLNNNFNKGFAIYFSKLEIFDKPKELGEFWADPIDFQVHTKAEANAEGYRPIQRAPQSWQYIYIEEEK